MTPHPSPLLPLPLDGLVVTAAGVEAFDCPVCQEPRDLVVPPCDGGRGHDHDECPDRACAGCGLALVVGHGGPTAAAVAHRAAPTRRAG